MDFAAGIYLSEAQNPPPAYILYTCIQYTYSHREGWESEPERRLEGQQFTKQGENTNMIDFISSL